MNSETNKRFDREYLKDLSESYVQAANDLSRRREELISRRQTASLPPDELRSVNDRIDILYGEICDLRSTAQHLRSLAAPPSPSPSLAARRRRLS